MLSSSEKAKELALTISPKELSKLAIRSWSPYPVTLNDKMLLIMEELMKEGME